MAPGSRARLDGMHQRRLLELMEYAICFTSHFTI